MSRQRGRLGRSGSGARDDRAPLFTNEEGYSLVELVVVVVIIGILVAVVIPTFLGAKGRAEDRAAEANLRTGLVTAKTYYTDEGVFTGFDAVEAKAIDASVEWVSPGPPNVGQIAIVDVTVSTVLLVAGSGSGKFFCILEDSRSGTYFNSGSAFDDVDEPVECPNESW